MTFVHRFVRPALAAGLLLVALAAISPALAADVGVSIAGKTFNPSQIVVPQGATVTWTVTQAVGEPHTVTSKAENGQAQGALFDSQKDDPNLTKLKDNGATFQFTFKDPGTYDYMCVVHAGMTGQVVVLAPGQSPPAESSGGDEASAGVDRKVIAAGILALTLVVLFGAAILWRRMNPA